MIVSTNFIPGSLKELMETQGPHKCKAESRGNKQIHRKGKRYEGYLCLLAHGQTFQVHCTL